LILISLFLGTQVYIRIFLRSPLEKLNEIVDAYAEGNYDPGAKLPYLEFQPFGTILSNMGKTIEEQIRELKESRKLLETVILQSPIPMIIADPDGRLNIFNDAWKDQLMIEETDEIAFGTRYSDISPTWKNFDGRGRFVPMDQMPLALSLQGKSVKNREIKVVRKDGSERWEIVSGTSIHDDTGELIAGFVAFPDITLQKISEHALRKSEKKYSGLLDRMNEAVFRMILADGSYEYFSPAAKSVFGYDAEDFIGRPMLIRQIIHPDFRIAFERERNKLAKGEVTALYEYKVIDPEGNEKWVRQSNIGIYNVEGKLIAIEGCCSDITLRKQAETEKETLETQLRQSQKMEAIGILAGGIAHDFNNILGIILGYTEVSMEDVEQDSRLYSHLSEMKTACLRARQLIRHILDFSRKSQPVKTIVNITPIVIETLKLIRASIPASIKIENSFRDILDNEDTLLANPTQLNQVLLNLCTNAAQSIDSGGRMGVCPDKIRITPKTKDFQDLAPGDYVRISINDTGCGIEPAIIEHIFDPYFTTKKVGKGSGMGLSVVYGIVKEHKGMIMVDSEVGKGSTFTIHLPIAGQPISSHKEKNHRPPTGYERILFVDDEKKLVLLGQEMLGPLGYQVEGATDPRNALAKFGSAPEKYDLVITDMTMPDLSGTDLSEKLLAIRPETPIILCTGHSEMVSEESARQMGIKAYLLKPLTRQKLAQTVRSVLDRMKSYV